jgi:hypothetical protein
MSTITLVIRIANIILGVASMRVPPIRRARQAFLTIRRGPCQRSGMRANP